MALSDLSFYQSLVRNAGISYVLRQGLRGNHSRHSPSLTDACPVPVSPPDAGSSGAQKPMETPDNDIPSVFLKYRRPAYCVWSYYYLPQDLQEGFTSPRCDLINSIIHNLQWSRKTYTFWPLSTFKENVILPDTELFIKGTNVIKPVYIFIFGSRAFFSLFKDREYTYGPHMFNDHQVIALPDFDSLLPDNRLLKILVWNTLRKYAPA